MKTSILFIVAVIASILGTLAIFRVGPCQHDLPLVASWVVVYGCLLTMHHLEGNEVRRVNQAELRKAIDDAKAGSRDPGRSPS